MRLIDADKLVEKMKNTSPNAYTVGQMIYLAENAPTAYDVEKVVERLRHLQIKSNSSEFDYGIDKAIEVMKIMSKN